jgi:hypothetical protein
MMNIPSRMAAYLIQLKDGIIAHRVSTAFLNPFKALIIAGLRSSGVNG